MECHKTIDHSYHVISDPGSTPGSHGTEVTCLFFMSGVLLLNSIWMMSKCVRRHVLSDVFFTFFFVFGCLGYGLHAIASQMLVAGDNWFVIVAKLMMTLSLASLLLNNCCVLEDLAPFRFRTVIWLSFFFQTFVAAMGVAAQLGDYFQGTMFFMTMMWISCTFTWAVAQYLGKVHHQFWAKCTASFVAACGTLTAAILEPSCGYAGHQICYDECLGVPGVHFIFWLIPNLGCVLILNVMQVCCPDPAILPPILCWKPPAPPFPAPVDPLPPVPEPDT